MLLTDRRGALWIPLFELGATLAFGAVIAAAVLAPAPAPDARGLWWLGAFELLLGWLVLDGVVRVEVRGDRVLVRRLRKPLDLPRHLDVGFITRGSARSAAVVVYLTDGITKHDVLRTLPLGLGRAERLASRLRAALDLSPTARAARAAEADALLLRDATAKAWAYYRTPRFRWSVGILLGFMLLYAIAMSVFAFTR